MALMWMVQGEVGGLYDAYRGNGIAAAGWNQLS